MVAQVIGDAEDGILMLEQVDPSVIDCTNAQAQDVCRHELGETHRSDIRAFDFKNIKIITLRLFNQVFSSR